MQPLVLYIRSNQEAKVILRTVAEWRPGTAITQALKTFIAEGKNFSSAEMRKRGEKQPLRVALLPRNLADVVALANALSGTPEAPLSTIQDYISKFFPTESVGVAFRGKGALTRLRNALFRANYWTLYQLRNASDKELLGIEGVNKRSISRIRLLSAADQHNS